MHKISAGYLFYGLLIGLFYHEAAYYSHFTGVSVLSVVHPHAIILGAAVFFLLPLFMKVSDIHHTKGFHSFLIFYNIGLMSTLFFMTARGVIQLFSLPISSFWDHMIGGLAGLGHLILTIGLVFLFKVLIQSCKKQDA